MARRLSTARDKAPPDPPGEPSLPVRIRDIAERAGFSTMAVSLALRGVGRVSDASRAKIILVAKEMGYRPNPFVASFQAAARGRRVHTLQAVFGWFSYGPTPDSDVPCVKPMWDGAVARASALGFHIDPVTIPPDETTPIMTVPARLKKIARARGFAGAIFSPGWFGSMLSHFDWPDFPVVLIGERGGWYIESAPKPKRPRATCSGVVCDYWWAMKLAIERLASKGYSRPGFVGHPVTDDDDERHATLAGYDYWVARRGLPRIPPCAYSSTPAAEARLIAWYRQHRPDAVVCEHTGVRDALAAHRVRCPRDVGLVHLHLSADTPDWDGVDHHDHRIGSAAIDILSEHVRQPGILPQSTVSIRGDWRDGLTLRRRPCPRGVRTTGP